MARLQDLPNEIVREVLSLVLPEDIETFAQTSRHISLLSRPFLEEHRRLIRLHHTFNSHPPPGQAQHTETRDGFSVGPIPTLFKDIHRNPRIGHYVKNIKLDILLDIQPDVIRDNNSVEAQKLYRKQRDLIDTAVARSDVLENRDQYKDLKDTWPDTEHGGEELLVALILPLLPNLNSLFIKWTSSLESYFIQMIPHGAVTGVPWLANLKTVRVEDCDGGLLSCDLRLFNSLPSLKSLTAYGVNDGYDSDDEDNDDIEDDEDNIDAELPTYDSHTTELALLRSKVSTQKLNWYLESFRSLQSFTFAYPLSSSVVNNKENFDPCWIRSALVARAKTTLQTLTILGPPRPDTFMGSLQAFEALEEIHTEWRFLFPDKCDLEIWPSRVLPASIYTLKLADRTDRSDKEYKVLIQGLQRAKEKTCLRLDVVEIVTDWWDVCMEVDELQGMCEEVGISLKFSDGIWKLGRGYT
ncbi:MAG: hypothetical protein ASARMPRED_006879 [Alectoria sarmentosa]|nr:MAG: hypothetical protein ASARMPRED_006879 [Alectoria sarmentosa]